MLSGIMLIVFIKPSVLSVVILNVVIVTVAAPSLLNPSNSVTTIVDFKNEKKLQKIIILTTFINKTTKLVSGQKKQKGSCISSFGWDGSP
jgi:hypothetical protein